jgi:hypothetical protein
MFVQNAPNTEDGTKNGDDHNEPITNTAWVFTRLCKLQKGCTRLATANDQVYQLLAHGRWFSPGTSPSSTTKSGRHDPFYIDSQKYKKIDQLIFRNAKEIYFNEKFPIF